MGVKLVVASGYEDLVRRLGLLDPRKAGGFARGELVTDSGSSRVFRFREPDPEGPLFYFKVYRYYRLRPLVTFTYRKSRARTEYESLAHLRSHGLPAVEPVAFGSHRVARVIRSCFLITRGAEGAVDLDAFLPAFFARPRDAAWRASRDRALSTLAGLVRRMHEADFFDHDLYFRNILVEPDSVATPSPRFWLLDHPKGEVIPGSRPLRRRLAQVFDLASLDKHAGDWFSRTQRLRFFRLYLGGAESESGARRLLDRIARLRAHMLRKRAWKLRQKSGRRSGKRGSRRWDAPAPGGPAG